MKKLSKTQLKCIIALCFMILVSYMIFSLSIGGDAVNGYREAGRYYVAEHGDFTEVSGPTWLLSLIWTFAVWIAVPLVMVCNVLLRLKDPDGEDQGEEETDGSDR